MKYSYNDEKDLSNFKKIDTASWETLKDNVFVRLINAKYIPKYNEDIVYDKKLDLAITFSVQECDNDGKGKVVLSHMLTNDDLKTFDVDITTVRHCAFHNMANNRKRRLMTFKEYTIKGNLLYPLLTTPRNFHMSTGEHSCGVLEDITYDDETNDEQENILVMTNKNDIFGASYMVVQEMLDEVYNRFGENFYILPMSTHFVMCVREKYVTKDNQKPLYEVEDDILDMVEDFNDSQNKDWKDILSYKAYYYIGNDGKYIFPLLSH